MPIPRDSILPGFSSRARADGHFRFLPRCVLVLLCLLGLLALPSINACRRGDSLQAIVAQQERGDFAGSIEPLRRLLANDRDDPHINYLYGRALSATGEISLAEWSLRKAAADPEWLAPAAMQLAVDAVRARNYETAIEMTGRVLEVDPDNTEARLLRARAYGFSRQHKEEALAEANRILEIDPDNLEALKPKIVALIELERIDEAVEVLAGLGRQIEESEVGPSLRGWYCATTAIFANDRGEQEEAAKRWEECLEQFPGHPNVVGSALEFFGDRGQHARVLEILRAAHEAEPDSLDYRRRLATYLGYAGRMQEAEQLMIESTQSIEPAYAPAAWLNLSKFYQHDMHDLDKAIEASSKAMELTRERGPVSPQLLFEFADTLLLAGEYERALAIADETSVEGQAEMIRARVAQERDEPARALEHYEKAFRLWPDNPWARYYAAHAAEEIGDFDRAIEAYRYAIRINPAATDARTRLGALFAAQGQPGDALEVLRHAAGKAPLDAAGELLSIRLWALTQNTRQVQEALKRFQQLGPAMLGKALASAGRGIRQRAGAATAAAALERAGATNLDVQDPSNPVALRALLRAAAEAGRIASFEKPIRANLEAHPERAGAHEMLGLWQILSGAPETEARAAFERAIEIDPASPGALAELARLLQARLLQENDPERALELFDRAAAADPFESGPGLDAARLLIALGRFEEAEKRLASLVSDHPYEADVVSELVELQLSQQRVDERTAVLARQAARFGRSVEEFEQLARVYRQLGDAEHASEADAKAERLRARLRARAGEKNDAADAPPRS